MGRKKKTVVFSKHEVPPADPTAAWVDPEGVRYLARADLLEINNIRQRIDLQVLEAQVLRMNADKLEVNVAQKVASIRHSAVGCDARKKELEAEYKELTNRLGEKYDIDFKTIGYDDESGKVTDLA